MKQTEGMTHSSESWQDKLDELTPEQKEAIEHFKEYLTRGVELVVDICEEIFDRLVKLSEEADEVDDTDEGDDEQ